MAGTSFSSVILLILQILTVLTVIATFILVVKLPTIKLKTKAASIGVTLNVVFIAAFYILKYLVFD